MLSPIVPIARIERSPQESARYFRNTVLTAMQVRRRRAISSWTSWPADFGAAETLKVWEKVGERLSLQSMPPKNKPQPSVEEAKTLHGWLDVGLAPPTRAGNMRKVGRLFGV